MKKTIISIALLCFGLVSFAQDAFDFDVQLSPIAIPNLPGLHSYAFAQHNGQWLVIGGRKDGVHARQPFASFAAASNNTELYVIDPTQATFWRASVSTLPEGLREQLQATNINFYQDADTLYLIGGYAFSASANTHKTFTGLISVQVSALMEAVKTQANLQPYFKQINNDVFAVTGGQLGKIGHTYYLVGGQRFDGRYNPMNHPTFTQEYTNQIRIFRIADNGVNLAIEDYTAWTDAQHLHRRDYNLAPAIFPDGHPGFTIFSGVFQYDQDLPWLYPVDIDTGGYTPRPDFAQYLNHYHCANAVLYDQMSGVHHTVFFGGMAQYTLDAGGTLVQDLNVPFVKTIARVTRYADGSLEEVKLPVEMPAFLGSGAEFFPHPAIPLFPNGVIRMDEVSGDSVLLGYIYGGIKSPEANIFFTNIASEAVPTVYRVFLSKKSVRTGEQPVQNPLHMLVSPNPATGDLQINYWLPQTAGVRIRLIDASGRLIGEFDEGQKSAGVHWLKLGATGMPKGMLMVNLTADTVQVTQKVILE